MTMQQQQRTQNDDGPEITSSPPKKSPSIERIFRPEEIMIMSSSRWVIPAAAFVVFVVLVAVVPKTPPVADALSSSYPPSRSSFSSSSRRWTTPTNAMRFAGIPSKSSSSSPSPLHPPRHRRQTTTAPHRPTTTTTTTSLPMAVEGDFDPAAIERSRLDVENGSIGARLRALYKFTRPHTIRGTVLASIAGTTRALLDAPPGAAFDWGALLPRAVMGMTALLLGNAFIVGINQIFDRDIDVMNKPFLPVASGEMSAGVAWAAVAFSGVAGPAIVYNYFPALLFRLYMIGWTLGAIYSVPPLRTKRNPLAAGLTIATVRGFLLNFGVYYAVKDAIGAPFAWSPKVSFIARFMTIFASVIAVTKDLPDVDGDRAYGISTLATRVGVARIANGASAILFMNYAHAVLTGVLSGPGVFHALPMVGGHAVLAAMLISHYKKLEPEKLSSIKTYYKHIWDLFYLEYVLYTLI